MAGIRSTTAGGTDRASSIADEWTPRFAERFPVKLYWFLSKGYRPHEWQTPFHSASDPLGRLTRFRHLVAGRRGGKTLSAAWEVLFYALHPREFHRDAHGEANDRPLWIWALAKDHKVGRPSLTTFLEVIRKAGLTKGKDYEYNKTEKIFEFYGPDGDLLSTVEFRSADDPQSLRGAGLDILWVDEAAFVQDAEAWHVVRPALSDKLGLLITTTTPHGKNWFYEEFWSDLSLKDPSQFRVEYTSIDNPHFPKWEWDYAMRHLHPVVFKQEYMAAFDAMAGVALPGDWLHYYVLGSPDVQTDDISVKTYRHEDGTYNLKLYLGVDPAISTSDQADQFAMALVGVTHNFEQAFLLDYFVGRIEFPDQVDKIREWNIRYRPQRIGVESVAYQAALAQQAARLEGMPPIVPVMTKAKKPERLLGMGPFFKIGRIRISKRHHEFIDQWVSYDPPPPYGTGAKSQKDDLLDAVEIALGVAGVLLPQAPTDSTFDTRPPSSIEEEALAVIRAQKAGRQAYDPELGSEA